MPINILIADDHPIFLKGLKEVIQTDGEIRVIAECPNGQDALAAYQQYSPEVIILDIEMPKMNGLEVAEKILQIHPEQPIILLTMHKEKAPFLKSLELGILGYVLKENAVTDVINAIYKVREGNTFLSPEMSTYLISKNKKSGNTKADQLALLTPAERQILSLVAEYKSSKEIADELFISEKTVFNHRMNIAKKLNLTGKNSLLRFAVELGR